MPFNGPDWFFLTTTVAAVALGLAMACVGFSRGFRLYILIAVPLLAALTWVVNFAGFRRFTYGYVGVNILLAVASHWFASLGARDLAALLRGAGRGAY